MIKWIEPIELPEGFWQECFVVVKEGDNVFVEINSVKRTSDSVYWYSDNSSEWCEFRTDIPVRVQILEYPTITEDAW